MNQITHEERAKVYADALATFGAELQLIVALEEMSELQKEICKALRGDIHPAHLAEELADATIMLEQVRQIFSINEPVCRMMDSKIVRLRQRIETAKAETSGVKKAKEYMGFNSHDCEARYKCPYCGYPFGDWALFHQDEKDGTKDYCPKCGKEFAR